MSDLPVRPVEDDPNLKLLKPTTNASKPTAEDGEQPPEADSPEFPISVED